MSRSRGKLFFGTIFQIARVTQEKGKDNELLKRFSLMRPCVLHECEIYIYDAPHILNTARLA